MRSPDEIADRLGALTSNLERQGLEALALENYRFGRMTVEEALDFGSLNEIDGFLKAHSVYEDNTM
jgi:hypothetical protein